MPLNQTDITKMHRGLFLYIFACILQYVAGYDQFSCEETSQGTRSCTDQLLGHNNSNYDTCKVEYFPSNSPECRAMKFGPLEYNTHIGEVSLKPYIFTKHYRDNSTILNINYTVLNITFSNIKWKTMKFRFEMKNTKNENHCRNIVISNDVTVNDQSVLYYDCYWSITDGNYNGQSHILDFEATDDKEVNRGQYYFNIPSAQMLSPNVTEKTWKPFVYIEIRSGSLKLHIHPPPKPLNIEKYLIEVLKSSDEGTHTEIKSIKNKTIVMDDIMAEVVYDYDYIGNNGSHYFKITPLHSDCLNHSMDCQYVLSPRIMINNYKHVTLNICIASLAAIIVSLLFGYYIILRMIRRFWCKDYKLANGNEIPAPTKVLVVYSNTNRLHAECVASFVTYLRSDYGFEIMYDGDISSTSHGDPYIWAGEAFRIATHVIFVAGPPEETNVYNNIYDKPIISAHRDVDFLIFSLIRANAGSRNPKDVINVFFDYSAGPLPIETRRFRKFYLLKDWQKLISYLSKNLLPKKQIKRTEKGRCFLDDLTRAEKLLNGKTDDVVIRMEKVNLFEKKVLL